MTLAAVPDPEGLHPVLQQWVRQILDLDAILKAHDGGQVEVRLYTNRGRVRRQPTVVLNGGPGELG